MSASLDALVPELRPYAADLVRAAGVAGLQPRVTSTLRSSSQQMRLYARYLAGHQPFPVAFPGTSAHEFGQAFDLVTSPFEALSDVGAYWQEQGGTWGGSRDPVHFELPGASQAHQHRDIAFVADLVLGMVPGISELELGATLLSLGFPRSQILQFLSGPISYVTQESSP